MDLVVKAQQFLAEEQELLADFLLDMNDAEGKEYAKAAGLWVTQIARVQGIKDALEMLAVSVEDVAE